MGRMGVNPMNKTTKQQKEIDEAILLTNMKQPVLRRRICKLMERHHDQGTLGEKFITGEKLTQKLLSAPPFKNLDGNMRERLANARKRCLRKMEEEGKIDFGNFHVGKGKRNVQIWWTGKIS